MKPFIKSRNVAIACLLFCAVASAQRLETTVFVPDSLCGMAEIDYLVWNPANNQFYAAAQSSGDVVAVAAGTGEKTARITVGDWPAALCVNPDRNKVYAIVWQGRNPMLAVIDGATNQLSAVRPLPFPGADQMMAAYLAGREKLYILEYEGQLAVFDANADTLIGYRWVGEGGYQWLAANRTADKLYALNEYGIITVIDGGFDSTRVELQSTHGPVAGLAVNETSNKIYSFWEDGVVVISGATDSIADTIALSGDTDAPTGIVCDAAANRIYAAYGWLEAPNAPAVAVIDGAADTVIAMVPVTDGLLALACNPVAHKVYAGFENDSVIVIDGTTNQVVAQIGADRYPRLLAFGAADNRIACAVYGVADLLLIDCAADTVAATTDVGDAPAVLGFAQDQDRLYAFDGWHSLLSVIDPATNTVRRTLALPGRIFVLDETQNALCYSRAQGKEYVALGTGGIAVIACAQDSLLRILPIPAQGICLDSAGGRLYAGGDSALWVIDVASDTLVARIATGSRTFSAFALNPVRQRLYCGEYTTSEIWVIDCLTNTVIAQLGTSSGHTQFTWCPAFDKVYARSDNNGELAVIDCSTNVVTSSRPGGLGVGTVRLSHSGTTLFCTPWYGDVSLFIDCATDSVIAEMTGPVMMGGAAWTRDDRRIYARRGARGVSVIDAERHVVADSIRTGVWPADIALHPTQNRVYVANRYSSSVAVIRDSALGIAEAPTPGPRPLTLSSGIIRGTLFLSPAMLAAGDSVTFMLDISGRRVQSLCAGRNDISRLAPGVYFVRSGMRPSAKVVIQK